MNIPDIVDNLRETDKSGQRLPRVFEVLNELLDRYQQVSIASGYFDLKGFKVVADKIEQARSARLLLGAMPSSRSDEHATSQLVIRFRRELRETMRTDVEGTPLNQEGSTLVERLIQFLSRPDVEVKIYKRYFLHGKLYLFSSPRSSGDNYFALVGSSNFTGSGLNYNTELNLSQRIQTVCQDLEEWFNKLWNDELSERFNEQLIEILKQSKFSEEITPFQVYLKTLYELYKDRLPRSEAGEVALPMPTKYTLMEWQRDGAERAKKIIERHGGVIIADTTGTGKTYVGMELLRQFAKLQDLPFLIISPAQLREMWEGVCHTLNLYPVMVTMEKLGTFDEENLDEFRRSSEYQKLTSARFVLVDESHNFRNDESNRYYTLLHLLHADGKQRKLALMTATPINNSVWDMYSQVKLISGGKESYFRDFDIPHVTNYFRAADKGHNTLFSLLNEISIRRPRPFIEKFYTGQQLQDGTVIKFPKRNPPINVNYTTPPLSEKTYSNTVGYLAKLEDKADRQKEALRNDLYLIVGRCIEVLNFAPYYVLQYEQKRKTEFLTKEDQEKYFLEIGRQQALVYLMKCLFLKRLESSLHAFKKSVECQREFQKTFLDVLQSENLLLDSSSFRKILRFREEDDFEFRTENLKSTLRHVSTGEYNIDQIKEAVRQDLDTLERILNIVNESETQGDRKLDELRRMLDGDLRSRKKVLVFTYFKDTAKYLRDKLAVQESPFSDIWRVNDGRKLRLVDSDVKGEDRQWIVERFAPLAQRVSVPLSEQIDILIATDVLSEGQNLQDSDNLINYDLHWNPVRMIQRGGRIDRLASPHETVTIYNFFPERSLDFLLSLIERLQKKILTIDVNIGMDATLFGEAINPKSFNAIRELYEGDSARAYQDLLEDAEGMTDEFLIERLMEFLKRIGIDKAEGLQDGIHSGLKISTPARQYRGIFFFYRVTQGTKTGNCLRYYDLISKELMRGDLALLRLIECDEVTGGIEKRLVPAECHHNSPAVQAIFKEVEGKLKEEVQFQVVQQQIASRIDRVQTRIRDIIDEEMRALTDEQKLEWQTSLRAKVLRQLPDLHVDTLRRAKRAYDRSANVSELYSIVKKCVSDYEATQTAPQHPEEARITLVCYEVLT